MAVRGWVFTLKYGDGKDWNKIDYSIVKYMIVGDETGKGETHYRHYQGFVRFTKTMRMCAVKDWLGEPAVHLEPQKGTPEQASDYCKKDGAIVVNYGTLETDKGKRTDIEEWTKAVRSGMAEVDLWDEFPTQMTLYGRAYEKLVSLRLKEQQAEGFTKLEVHYIYGQPGTGKTRLVYEKDPDVYRIDHGSGGSVLWFNGYEGQKAVLFDDFRGNVKLAYMLQLLDGYKMQLQVKGGYTYKLWERVYITSNVAPDMVYHGVDDASRRAFLRRITSTTLL